jgi:hypothetical protein
MTTVYVVLKSLENQSITCLDGDYKIKAIAFVSLFYLSKIIRNYVKDNESLEGIMLPCNKEVIENFVDLLHKCETTKNNFDTKLLTNYFPYTDKIKTVQGFLEILFLSDYLDLDITSKMDKMFNAVVNRSLKIVKENGIGYEHICDFCQKYNPDNKYFNDFYKVVYRDYFERTFKDDIDNVIKDTIEKLPLSNKHLSDRQLNKLKKEYLDNLKIGS